MSNHTVAAKRIYPYTNAVLEILIEEGYVHKVEFVHKWFPEYYLRDLMKTTEGIFREGKFLEGIDKFPNKIFDFNKLAPDLHNLEKSIYNEYQKFIKDATFEIFLGSYSRNLLSVLAFKDTIALFLMDTVALESILNELDEDWEIREMFSKSEESIKDRIVKEIQKHINRKLNDPDLLHKMKERINELG